MEPVITPAMPDETHDIFTVTIATPDETSDDGYAVNDAVLRDISQLYNLVGGVLMDDEAVSIDVDVLRELIEFAEQRAVADERERQSEISKPAPLPWVETPTPYPGWTFDPTSAPVYGPAVTCDSSTPVNVTTFNSNTANATVRCMGPCCYVV